MLRCYSSGWVANKGGGDCWISGQRDEFNFFSIKFSFNYFQTITCILNLAERSVAWERTLTLFFQSFE